MFLQEAESKYNNIITGHEGDDTSKGKNLFLDLVPGQRNLQIRVAFSFHKAQKR